MKIEYGKAVERFTEFMEGNVAKVPDLGKRFLMYATLGALKANPEAASARVRPSLEMAGILDGDGMVDVEVAAAALSNAFANIPSVTFAGFTFTKEDAADLLGRMRP